MKHYYESIPEDYGFCHERNYREYYVGKTADIKAMYKSIARNKSTDMCPLFCDFPKFSEYRQVYALCIDENNYITIINSDTMLAILLEI